MHLKISSPQWRPFCSGGDELTHWGRVTHICVKKLTSIGSGNGLSPVQRQAIIWTITGILLIGTLGTNFSEILIEIRSFSFKKMHFKMSSGKWRPFCIGHNVLKGSLAPEVANLQDRLINSASNEYWWSKVMWIELSQVFNKGKTLAIIQ